jgi:tRNA pseudouridine32 synthase/23S rRNA pseudouridine746 synthase
MHIPVLHESQDLLVVSKPVAVSTIPGGKGDEKCLLQYLEEIRDEKLWVVHRLDKEVSGIVVFARNELMHKYLNSLFMDRSVQKTYLALVIGNLKEKEGTIDQPIREFGSGRMGVAAYGGKESITSFQLIAKGFGHSLIKVTPETGRRHQIRVHLYYLGYPIAGDPKYGDKKVQEHYSRLMLHAYSLSFPLMNGETISVKCNPPEEFSLVLSQYGIKGVQYRVIP